MKIKNTIMTHRDLLFLAVILASFATLSCSSENQDRIVIADDSMAIKSNEITLSTAQFEANGMQLSNMEWKPFTSSIKTNGFFDVPPQNRASVSPYYAGYVKEVHWLPGEAVSKGEVLFTLENPEFVQMQEEYLDAKGQLSFLKSDYERQKSLVADNVTSEKKYLKAEADYNSTKVKYEGLRKKLALMNIDADQLTGENITTTISITSPISGSVTQVNINKGSFVNPSDIAMSVVNTDHMHLELSIFEQDLASIKVDQAIKFRIQNGGKTTYDAHVYLINHSIDLEKRTIAIHGHLTDEEMRAMFTPGMYIEAEILTSSDTLLCLPEDAVVAIEDKNYVLFQTSQNTESMNFEQREVSIGKSTNGMIEIRNHSDFGIQAIFLSKGAFNLINN